MKVMYIRKDIANFLEKMPKEMKIPRKFKSLVKKCDIKYNLLIKHGNECECTNCGKYFFSKQIQEGNWGICPFCNNKYRVRRSNLKSYSFFYDLAIVDNVDNKLILRFLEVRRSYDDNIRRFKDNVVEYARIVPDLDIELVNDRYTKCLMTERVKHTKRIKRWRVFTGRYGLHHCYQAIYLDNIEEKTKGTIYQYAPIRETIEYLNNEKVDFLKILKLSKYSSFELLIKAGLYKLALECPEKFNEKGSFEKRFGINKKYYKFMKKHDIAYEQLAVLKIMEIPNINKINSILKICNKNIRDLEEVSKYLKLDKIEEYSKKQKGFFVNNYLDYIHNMEKLGVPLTKKILLPEDFEQAHNESVNKVTIVENEEMDKKIHKRSENLAVNIYMDNEFFIRPANSLNDLRNEAKQQNNCVYKNYSESYALGKTDIYFLRKVAEPDKSVVTVEVLNRNIRQKYQKGNKVVTKKQDKFLQLWQKEVLRAA